MHRRLVVALTLALVLVLVLVACGGDVGGSGGKGEQSSGQGPSTAPAPAPADEQAQPSADDQAQLWVTRDEGAAVLLAATVPAGLTVMQALDREADIETRYGGRYVQAIEGIEGSLTKQQDWFYFLNGIEPDVGAAEVRLRPGDVAWWDFRSWATEMDAPVVVGAFPEPFLHGFDGHTRPAEVQAPAELAAAAAALERLLGAATGTGEPNLFVLEVRDGATGASLSAQRDSANDSPVRFVLSGSADAVRAAALTIADSPETVRFHYRATFDEQGRVVP